MARARAFSLIELLNVVAIIGILGAVLMPAVMSVRSMAYQYSATMTLKELGQATSMYAADSDETFMPAFYGSSASMQFWFGTRAASLQINSSEGLLQAYTGRKALGDISYKAAPYLGNMSGFGYNWAFLGSDFGITGNFDSFPECMNPASVSALSHPSKTIVMASSSYYFASWLPKSDQKTYDFGFIDPPGWWNGNPNMDFRYMAQRAEVPQVHLVTSKGNAVVAFADGHAGTLRQSQVLNENFLR